MNTQRVEVLHITYGDAVVIAVTHHLILNLFPAFERLLNQNLGRVRKSTRSEALQLIHIGTEARTQTTERVCSTHNDREAQLLNSSTSLLQSVGSNTARGLYINLTKTVCKNLAVLSLDDCLNRSTEHANIILLQHTTLEELHTAVQCGLTTKRQKDAIGTLTLDNLLNEEGSDGEIVDFICYTLRSLYSSNIGVDKDSILTLLTHCFECLRA